MKDIVVIDSEKNITKSDIYLLEAKLGINLPIEYKDFLLLHNGGRPEKDHYGFVENDNGSVLDWFFAIYKGDNCINLLKEFLRHENRIPKEFIPIARDPGSNIVCLGVNGSEYGKVYFWEFDQAVPYGEEPNFDNMYLLANNFTDFINGLYKFINLKKDINGEEIWIYSHDKYSLPFSTEAKRYGALVTDFFVNAPAEVEDYVIEEYEANKDIILYYDVKFEGKRYKRIINVAGEVKNISENFINSRVRYTH